MALFSEVTLDMISVFLNFSRVIWHPRYELSQRMFHVHLRRKAILLLLKKCPIDSI